MQPDSVEISDRKRDSSALCLACGLCCKGVLYVHVSVEPEHLPLVSRLGLTVEEFEDHSVGFRQPCVLYHQDRCSVYPDHPPPCKTFRCALLRKYEDGNVTLADGLAIVHQAQELLGDYSVDTLRREVAQRRDSANAALVLQAATLDTFLQRHFLPPKKDK